MILPIDELRKACRAVSSLSTDSIAGYGTAAFLDLDDGCYLVSGSQRSKMGGVKLDVDVAPELIGLWFDVRGLGHWLSASFAHQHVDVSLVKNRIEFKVGRNYRKLPYKEITTVGKMLTLPKPTDGLVIDGLLNMARVGHMAHKNPTHIYSGVYVAVQSGYVHMLAMDGFSAGYVWGKSANVDLSFECVIPSETVLLIRQIDWESEPKFLRIDNALWFMDGRFFLTSPRMSGEYPGSTVIEVVREYGGTKESKVSVVELFDKLDALTNIQRDKRVSAVRFDFCDEGLILSSGERDQGEGRFYLAADDIEDMFIVNGYAVKTAGALLKDMASTPTIFFSRHEKQNWLVLRPIEGNGIFCLALMEF